MQIKKYFFILIVICLSFQTWANIAGDKTMQEAESLSQALLVFDEDFNRATPRNFRTHQSPFVKQREPMPSRTGLENLRFSGSGQFSEHSLKAVLPQMQGEIWIIDLRRENHGFINGMPISWYVPENQSNLQKRSADIEQTEALLLHKLMTDKPVIHEIIEKAGGRILKSKPHTIDIKQVESERTLCQRLGLQYARLPVSDHHPPTDAEVDAFILLMRELPKEAWLHFHCRAGKGRTTSFIAMYDMLHNAKQVPFEDLVRRHYLMGGANLLHVSNQPDKQWKHAWGVERKSFLAAFYAYAKETDFRDTLWSAWVRGGI